MENVKFKLKILSTVEDARSIDEFDIKSFLMDAYVDDDMTFWECQNTIADAYMDSSDYKEAFLDSCYDDLANEQFIKYVYYDSKESIKFFKPCGLDDDIDSEPELMDIYSPFINLDAKVVVELPLIFDWKTFAKDYKEDTF